MAAFFCFLLFKGSSQTDESSSQRTSSSVLAKEALIEIDYSNLSEDLKVGLNNIIVLFSMHQIIAGDSSITFCSSM